MLILAGQNLPVAAGEAGAIELKRAFLLADLDVFRADIGFGASFCEGEGGQNKQGTGTCHSALPSRPALQAACSTTSWKWSAPLPRAGADSTQVDDCLTLF